MSTSEMIKHLLEENASLRAENDNLLINLKAARGRLREYYEALLDLDPDESVNDYVKTDGQFGVGA